MKFIFSSWEGYMIPTDKFMFFIGVGSTRMCSPKSPGATMAVLIQRRKGADIDGETLRTGVAEFKNKASAEPNCGC